MALEAASFISDLNASNPTGSDGRNTADDHLRLIKAAVKATFPNVAGAVTPTHTELNYVGGVTSAIQTQLGARVLVAGANSAIGGYKTVGFHAEYDNESSGASKTITLTNGQKQKITLTANTTLTVSFTDCTVGDYQIRLIQDGTGGRTLANITGLSTSRWLGSAAQPAINAAANGETLLTISVKAAGSATGCLQSMVKVGA
jgi:hypothetical protein